MEADQLMRYFDEPSVETKVENQGAVVSLHGRVTIGSGDVELRNEIRDLLDHGVTDVVIELGDVTRIDSSGIGELVAAHIDVTNRGGTLELRGIPANMRDVLSITNFPDFPNFPDGFGF